MKKGILTLALTTLFLLSGITLASGQEQPKPQKDTVNADTDAKPTFYYAVEDEESAGKGKFSTVSIILIAAAVVVVGAGVVYLLKKKK